MKNKQYFYKGEPVKIFEKIQKQEAMVYIRVGQRSFWVNQKKLKTASEKTDECVHEWKYLSGTPENKTCKCKKCGVVG